MRPGHTCNCYSLAAARRRSKDYISITPQLGRRGGADIREIVKRIDMWALDMVFVVGGNGGNAGADAIQCECQKANIPCAVIGVPKSIDNDILLVSSVLRSLMHTSLEAATILFCWKLCPALELKQGSFCDVGQPLPVVNSNAIGVLILLAIGLMCRLTSALDLTQLSRSPREHFWRLKSKPIALTAELAL